jgi:hypothetical protein
VLPVLGTALLASLAALTYTVTLRRGAPAAEGEEEALLRRTIARLREQLHLTREDGYYLSTEPPPSTGWRAAGAHHAPPVCLRTAHVEALARLELLADFDSLLVDAMCACLGCDGPLQQPFSRSSLSLMNVAAEPGCSPQQVALRAWLLGLALQLLDPMIDDAAKAAQPEPTSVQGKRLPSAGPFLPILRVPSSVASATLTTTRSVSLSVPVHVDDSEARKDLTPVLTRASSAKARFSYLENKVGGDSRRWPAALSALGQ